MQKVFGIGLIKTGTSTLGVCLGRLRYNHCTGYFKLTDKYVPYLLAGDYKPIFELARTKDSFEDLPWCSPGFYQLLDKEFLGSKFILTVRDSTRWLKSFKREYFSGAGPGLTQFVEATFDLSSDKSIIETYEKHNKDVQQYFQGRDNLLVVDWEKGDSWKELCNFLNQPVLDMPFPHVNRHVERKALMTLVFDGGPIFEAWYKYYTQFFAEEDIYVLTHESPPEMFEGKNCNLLKLPHSMCQGSRSDVENLATINDLQHRLFDGINSSTKPYPCVVYADFDEIIYHPLGLDYILNTLEEDFLTCTGYEIVHKRQGTNSESDLDWSKPILSQRSFWYRWQVYDKPLILRKKFDWECGIHALRGPLLKYWLKPHYNPPNQMDNLYLLHLHKVDWNTAKTMHQKYVKESQDSFKVWWRRAESQVVEIPKEVKDSLAI